MLYVDFYSLSFKTTSTVNVCNDNTVLFIAVADLFLISLLNMKFTEYKIRNVFSSK